MCTSTGQEIEYFNNFGGISHGNTAQASHDNKTLRGSVKLIEVQQAAEKLWACLVSTPCLATDPKILGSIDRSPRKRSYC